MRAFNGRANTIYTEEDIYIYSKLSLKKEREREKGRDERDYSPTFLKSHRLIYLVNSRRSLYSLIAIDSSRVQLVV